ncbi:MAG: methyltransferase domain-containing protein [Nitrospiraceae bacterium]|nr:MAG: methyltransferase domain-containing protein [Nitrospiraceae bacterium]
MSDETITQQVSERYARAVTTGEQMCCPTGYNFDDLRAFVPEEVLRVSYGCGTPAGLATVRPGETVLDIGSGGGIDCFEAARRVGPSGRVIGIDMTDEMLAMARRNTPIVAKNLGYAAPNVEFRKGHAENLPVEDGTIDLIISNCVINLAPDKARVFREMFRAIRPGGRFTISDIVADQPVPQYLIHDTQKWGDCLSGALPAWEYLGGLVQAGFLGVHQMKFSPWSVIDGIHFFSLTLTGYKLPEAAEATEAKFATLVGPFSRAVDELGQTYHRGKPAPVSARAAQLLKTPPFERLFLLAETPILLATTDQRLVSILPADAPCVWKGHYAILTAPFAEAEDDDHHVYWRGVPLEICSKTLDVLDSGPYSRHFTVINRATEAVSGEAVSCDPGGGCC